MPLFIQMSKVELLKPQQTKMHVRAHLHVVMVVIAALYHMQCAILHARGRQAMMHILQALAAIFMTCITAANNFRYHKLLYI